MLQHRPERHIACALGELDLDPPTVVDLSIVIGDGGWQELKAEHSDGKYLADAAH